MPDRKFGMSSVLLRIVSTLNEIIFSELFIPDICHRIGRSFGSPILLCWKYTNPSFEAALRISSLVRKATICETSAIKEYLCLYPSRGPLYDCRVFFVSICRN